MQERKHWNYFVRNGNEAALALLRWECEQASVGFIKLGKQIGYLSFCWMEEGGRSDDKRSNF